MPHKFSHHDEERKKSMSPEEIFRRFGLKEKQILADLGCGAGFFTITAAQMTGPGGRVEAVDIAQDRLLTLAEDLRAFHLSDRVGVHLATSEQIPLPAGSVHVVFIANVLHELKDHR